MRHCGRSQQTQKAQTSQSNTPIIEGGSSYFPMLEELLPWGSLSPNWTSRINTWMSPQSSTALVLHCACLLVSYKCNRGHITMLPGLKTCVQFSFDRVSCRLMRLTAGGGGGSERPRIHLEKWMQLMMFATFKKYGSEHEKKSQGRTDKKKKKTPHASTVNTWEK